jgi:hypothetical protein
LAQWALNWTHRAHAALQAIKKLELSFQSIMGATENLELNLFISLNFYASTLSYKGLGRLANLAGVDLLTGLAGSTFSRNQVSFGNEVRVDQMQNRFARSDGLIS